jgi:hypothetical protein
MVVRLLTLITAIAAGGVIGSASARAVPPDNTRQSGSDSFITRNTCADPVRVDSQWSVVVHTHYDAAGDQTRVQYTGTTRITYTDLTNLNSYSPNSSGPGTYDTVSGATVIRGSNGAVFNNDGILVSTSGRIVYDANFNIVSIVGKQRPVCTMLATVPSVAS